MTAPHTCHALVCQRTVRPRFLMCPRHWRLVPVALQDALWSAYSPGQEIRKDPTVEYLYAAHACILAVADAEQVAVPEQTRKRWTMAPS